ncbi:MAG: HAMP domain-containing sensor histidine kinase [Lachnospiraceae bacterium]|nr:HAMP domain-containing sensor histidine kinase [Lachnospiraceae bacterium]
MKKVLYVKFIIAYVILGVLGFFTVSTLGSRLIEDRLIEQTSESLYQSAYSISSSHAAKYFSKANSLNDLYDNLTTVGTYQDSVIWIIDSGGRVIVGTDQTLNETDPPVIDNFDPAAFGPKYYELSNFYKQFQDKKLSVMVPIVSGMTTKGYVAVFYPAQEIYTLRESILLRVYIVYGVIFVLSLMILFLFTVSVYVPLRKITEGATEYASGNLKHNIDVKTSDEMGYLASTLNYMSDELDKSNDYQRSFIANVSHDFRSPLTSIKGYADAISDGTIPPEMYPRYLGIISSETERLEKLTRGMLELNNMDSRKKGLEISDFDINAVIKNTTAVFEGTCRKKKISIELVLVSSTLFVSADMGKIQQVLYNLLDNAIKFSDKNSTITIETTLRHQKVFVSVKDSGVGIPKEKLNKIWDRFYKIDSSRGKDRKGTGLGLAIVKEIVNAHNQNINVISTEGVGTEFIFSLELAK